MQKTDLLDAVVIGGGPSGSVAAHVLARAGRQVLLVDRAPRPGPRIGESLPGAARPILRALDLLHVVDGGPHLLSTGNCSAWGSSQIATTDFILDPNGPGWRLDRARFDRDLRAQALASGAQGREASVTSLEATAQGWRVLGRDLDVRARWIVNATGRRSPVGRILGESRHHDDELVAVYAWIRPARARSADARAWVESAAEGWWYTTQLPEGRQVVAFHTRPATARRLMRSPGEFRARLSETLHVRKLIGRGLGRTRLSCTEASGSVASRISGPGWIAAGDAAVTFDPLSSQGIFNALYTGMKASRAVDRALSGDASGISTYENRLRDVREIYLQRRNHFYSQERRWPEASFWKGESHALA